MVGNLVNPSLNTRSSPQATGIGRSCTFPLYRGATEKFRRRMCSFQLDPLFSVNFPRLLILNYSIYIFETFRVFPKRGYKTNGRKKVEKENAINYLEF